MEGDKEVTKSRLLILLAIVTSCSCSVAQFDPNSRQKISFGGYENIHTLQRGEVIQGARCWQQDDRLKDMLLSTNTRNSHTFANLTIHTPAVALAWTGESYENLLIVGNEGMSMLSSQRSFVLRSTDYATFVNITEELGGLVQFYCVIKRHDGLQRHPHDTRKVYLITEGTCRYLYTSVDGGITFVRRDLSFEIDGGLIFGAKNTENLIAVDKSKNMFVSKDNGANWIQVDVRDKHTGEKTKVDKVVWGVGPDGDQGQGDNPDTTNTIYFTYGDSDGLFSGRDGYILAKSTDGGKTYRDLMDSVVSFVHLGKFLFVTHKYSVDSYTLKLSTDGGAVFNNVQVPTASSAEFFRVLGVDDNVAFIHVDNAENVGEGTIVTSDGQGIIYSVSLHHHLFPQLGETSDFYKVKSMRGVYITSQLAKDNSIRTMITYNHGKDWQEIPRPVGVPCKDETKECYLQIHGMYSLKRGVKTGTPLSEEGAVGLILAHGHVADALQTTDPDVFISRDGGYTWNWTLKGPHHYQIGDHGGLLLAVSKTEPTPQVVKFSIDEGRCWHEYKFTDKIIRFTGMLIQPGGLAMMVWGYNAGTKTWEINVIDFKKVKGRKCTDNDYESWTAHATQRANERPEMRGCLLGIKETFMRLKKDSWCYNGNDHKVDKMIETCHCTRADYNCDNGFFQPDGSSDCIMETGTDIRAFCLLPHHQNNLSFGYRKLLGNKCVGGFKPSGTFTDMMKVCDELENGQNEKEQNQTETKYREPSHPRWYYNFTTDSMISSGYGQRTTVPVAIAILAIAILILI